VAAPPREANVQRLVLRKLSDLATDPYVRNNNVKRLTGDWRVIYELHDEELVVLVVKFGPRSSIYD
jgi:mRNA-degrading endonuclease RelE of RelBE toxin-antitoxin system